MSIDHNGTLGSKCKEHVYQGEKNLTKSVSEMGEIHTYTFTTVAHITGFQRRWMKTGHGPKTKSEN